MKGVPILEQLLQEMRTVFPETIFFWMTYTMVHGYDLEQYTIGQANFEYL